MPKKKESLRITANNNYSELWIPEELKPYLNDTPEIRALLERFTSFTPHKWDPDALVEWVSTTFSTSLAENLLTANGYERARTLFSKRRIQVEDWALSRPGWWEIFEARREKHLADYFIYEPPLITPEKLPLALESWWHMYIKEPVESDPRRRCAYLVAAGLLPKDFTADDLIRFAANRRREPSPDTTYAEWDLTDQGNTYLIAKNKKTSVRTKTGLHKKEPLNVASTLGVNCWEGLIIGLEDTLIRAYAKESERAPKEISLDEMGIKKGKGNTANNSYRLLLMLAARPGRYNPEEDKEFYGDGGGVKRFKQDLFRLNKGLRETFGLKGVPISRSRRTEDKGIVRTLFELRREDDEKTILDSKGTKKEIASMENTKKMKRKDLTPEEIEDIITPTHTMKHSI